MILPIFPEGGLTSSVITTVWVGVFILAFFNLRFGWVMSGLVVPGYIVPLLIIRPIAASVIVVEAILTYAIVWLFSERLARGRFHSLFGRDRFMGLVLASIAVRVTLDGWLLPLAADWLGDHWDRQIDWHSNLQSFGLVVISLMANQFWKPGLLRGLFSMVVVTGLTWLVVRYGLMEFTNFRLSGVSYVYEGLASSILASPKAYIILVITAFIASQMNVRYGWDFSGILIPALIALQWYQPTKILSSFVEAGIIYFLAQMVLKLPFLAGVTIEGARKLVLFFNVSFVYKLLLGHALVWLAVDVKTTDFYGFGYLLSTLLAIKAYDKHIFPRVMRSTLEVSVAGAALGNLVGLTLALFLPAQQAGAAAERTNDGPGTGDTGLLLAAAVGDAHLRASGAGAADLSTTQARDLEAAIDLLDAGGRADFVASALRQSGLSLTAQSDGTLAIARQSGTGRDLLLFNPRSRSPLAVIVPDATAAPGVAAAGLALFRAQQARWLLVAAPAEPGAERATMLDQLRSATRAPELIVGMGSRSGSALLLEGSGATALELGGLRRSLPGLVVSFEQQLGEGAQATRDRANLLLSGTSLEHLAGTAAAPVPLPACDVTAISGEPAPEPDLAELAFLRMEIAEPVVSAMTSGRSVPQLARNNADLAGLVLDRCLLAERLQWRLASADGKAGRYLLDPAGDRSQLIDTVGDEAEVLAAASAVYRSSRAGALLIAPTETQLIGSQRSRFGVISQTLLRAMGKAPGSRLQLRPIPFGVKMPQGDFDLAVVPDLVEPTGNWSQQMVALARQSGFKPRLVDRSAAVAGLEIAPNLSVRYLNQSANKRYATFWIARRPAKAAGQ